MTSDTAQTRSRLRDELRHRIRPMTGRDPRERGRTTTPLELLYDLTYVIAFAAAAEQLAHYIGDGHALPAIGAYAFAIFAVSWAWMNYTWFTSAYGNDDALFRVATIVQMIGVIILTFGLPVSFSSAVHGESPNNLLMVVGYIIMRVPLIGLWLRAARQDAAHRRVDIAYAIMIGVAQTGWALTAIIPMPAAVTIGILIALGVAELAAPIVVEKRLGPPPWNAGHIAERFSLLTLITIGEVVAAVTTAVGSLVDEQGWSAGAALIAASGLVIAASLWWAYFLIPSAIILERWPDRIYAWRYAHLPIFGAIAAVGAGLRVAADAIAHESLSLLQVALALAIPLAALVLMIYATWMVLLHSYDLSHIPLLLGCLLPLAAAVVVAALVGGDPIDLAQPQDLATLVIVVGLVACAGIVEVVGHEVVGYRHTVRALEGAAA